MADERYTAQKEPSRNTPVSRSHGPSGKKLEIPEVEIFMLTLLEKLYQN